MLRIVGYCCLRYGVIFEMEVFFVKFLLEVFCRLDKDYILWIFVSLWFIFVIFFRKLVLVVVILGFGGLMRGWVIKFGRYDLSSINFMGRKYMFLVFGV